MLLPADVAAMTPEAASPVPGGVLIMGRTGADGDLEAALRPPATRSSVKGIPRSALGWSFDGQLMRSAGGPSDS